MTARHSRGIRGLGEAWSSQACQSVKIVKARSGMARPTGPLASTAPPRAMPQLTAQGHDVHPGPSSPPVRRCPIAKHHRLSVVKKTRGASGVADRPPTAVQTHVAMASPATRPAGAPQQRRAICQTTRQVMVVRMAEPRRAPVSVGPARAKPARWSQLTRAGFSTRRRPLKVGTTQSPRSSMASEQAAFLGSSSSHSAGPPRFVRSTSAAATATTTACRRGGITAGHLPGGGGRTRPRGRVVARGGDSRGSQRAGQAIRPPPQTRFRGWFGGVPGPVDPACETGMFRLLRRFPAAAESWESGRWQTSIRTTRNRGPGGLRAGPVAQAAVGLTSRVCSATVPVGG